MEKKLAPFLEIISDLKAKVDLLNTQLSTVQKQYNELRTSKEEDIEMMCREAEERIKRRKYVIVSGVSENHVGSLAERVAVDTNTVKRIAHKLGMVDFEPKEISRVGKMNNSRPRLLRFKCSHIHEKAAPKIIDNIKIVNSAKFSSPEKISEYY